MWNGENGQLINCDISNNYVSQFLGSIVYWNASQGTIDGCTFSNNDLSSNNAPVSYPVLWFGDDGTVSNSIFINNTGTVNGGAIYWGGGADNGLIYNCTFINNTAWYGGAIYWNGANGTVSKSYFKENSAISYLGNTFKGGAIYWYSQEDGGKITGCVFVDNVASSGEAIAIGSNTFLVLENSVFINNNITNANTVNATTDSASAIANNNWWGNTIDDLTEIPNTYGNITVDSWLFLNVTASPTNIYAGKYSNITFDLTHSVTAEGEISEIESYELHDSDLNIIDVVGGTVDESIISFENGTATIQYHAVGEGNGSLAANVLGLDFIFNFTIETSKLKLVVDDIYIGQNATIFVQLPYDATGNVTVTINNENYIIELKSGKGNVTISNLTIGSYNVYGYYDGNDLNPASDDNESFNVLQKESLTISIEEKEVYEEWDFTVNITTSDSVNINVTVIFDNTTTTVEIIDGLGVFEYSNLSIGEYPITVIFDGNYKYNETTSNATITVVEGPNIIVNAPDVVKYYGGSERFRVKVTDKQGNPISGQLVGITIAGVQYNKTTNSNGTVTAPLSLNSGVYDVIVTVNETTTTATATIKTTVSGNDVIMVFRNGTQYIATFLDAKGNYLSDGTQVTFNINGVFYDRYVRSNGTARLNIKLEQGTYVITAINNATGEKCANNITVLSRIVENNDLVKYYRNASQYKVRIIGNDGNPVGAGEIVSFNINGVFYNRTTNASGYAKLNIKLQPGNYVITAEYNGCKVSNNIEVKQVLFADDLSMNYMDESTFKAKLLDGHGNPLANEKITFNVNGVLYIRTTNSSGIASLNIRLQAGEYIITSSYNDNNIVNTIKIS